MKKVVLAVCLLVLLTSLSACSVADTDLVQVVKRSSNPDIHASIGDYSDTLQEMLDYADLILIGKVVKQDNFGDYSVMTEVEVSRIVKGKKYDVVSVIQLKDGNELTIGEDYLLALVSQRPDYEEDYYAVCASSQGMFRQRDKGIEIYDDTFVKEIRKYIEKSDLDTLSLKDLADWFEAIIKD